MSGAAAARVGDPIAHSHAGLGMMLGLAAGVVAGVVLVGATIATGGAALVVVAAVGGAAGLASFGGLKGMNIGEASMGPPCGQFVTGAPSVLINGRPATFTAGAFATCSKESGAPIPLATGAATVTITAGLAGRVGETLGCSAKSVSAASPDVVIGGPSAADPAVTVNPEVPGWAVTGLQVLGVAGALLTLPYSVVALGVAGTLGVGALGMVGSAVGGKAMRAAGEAMGMSEAGVRAMEATGELGGGLLAGGAGARKLSMPSEVLAPQTGDPATQTPSEFARSWQGQGDYLGVDKWNDTVLKSGEVIYGGSPGQSNYYTTESALNQAGGGKQALWEGLQVKPHDQFGYRPSVQAYRVTQDTPAATSITGANPVYGPGGLQQIAIQDFSSLAPIGDPIPLR